MKSSYHHFASGKSSFGIYIYLVKFIEIESISEFEISKTEKSKDMINFFDSRSKLRFRDSYSSIIRISILYHVFHFTFDFDQIGFRNFHFHRTINQVFKKLHKNIKTNFKFLPDFYQK